MTISTETNLQEIKDLIVGLDKKIEIQILELEKKIDTQFAEVKGEIKRLDERINGLDKRIDSLETLVRDQGNRFWALVGGAFLALFGLLAKMAFFPTGNI